MSEVLAFPVRPNLGSASLDRELFNATISRLVSLRIAKGISAAELAAQLGITEEYILSVEASKRSPSLGMLLVWLNRLNATLADISA